jgi:23S rRNA pseudouridine2605 synthase
MKERLHKVMAHAGVASRRAAERLIKEGRVKVNGVVVDGLGAQVDPDKDRIEVDGQPVAKSETRHHYILLNKPLGVVSTAQDPEGRPTVVQIVDSPHRLYPVGRLDIDSEGLVLLTDDGELTFRLTHARFGIEKEYHVEVRCPNFGPAELEQLHLGVMLEDGLARAVRAAVLDAQDQHVMLRVVLHEGRQRQVRRMLGVLGCNVDHLERVRIGPLVLGDIAPGESRPLKAREVDALRTAVGLST